MSLKIIVVDDEAEELKLIKSMVEPLGCEVLTVEDSREGARRIESEKFDGVLLDALMPHLDGFELAKQVRASQLNREVPIVLISELDDLATMRRGFNAGASCFLPKPINQERLYSLIKAMRGPMLREKRRHARLPLQTPVKCKSGLRAHHHFISGSLTISEGGILLESSGGLEVGQELEMEFTVPETRELLTVRGKVIHRELPDRIAVLFLDLTEDGRAAIQRYIAGVVKL